jgi:Iodothyronine deiodinase
VVYIEEAHPTDGWQMPSNVEDHILIADAKTQGERDEAAHVCVVKLGIKIPAVVDDMQDSTERAYTGWPDRLYVIAGDGRVAYKSQAGPFGFHPKEMAKALQAAVSPSSK